MTECQNCGIVSEYMFLLQNSRVTLEMFHIQRPLLFSRALCFPLIKEGEAKMQVKQEKRHHIRHALLV